MVKGSGVIPRCFSVIPAQAGLQVACFLLAGCATFLDPAPNDPMRGEGTVTMELLQSQNREAQRMIAELRTELEASRQTLAEALVARAQLAGQVRETERRYGEARQIVELQREELARLREERHEIVKTSQELKAQMQQLQVQLASLIKGGPRDLVRASPEAREPASPTAGQAGVARLTGHAQDRGDGGTALLNGSGPPRARDVGQVIVVQRGDTLWSIARRHGVSFAALRRVNDLDDNPHLIFPGQKLRLPPPRTR